MTHESFVQRMWDIASLAIDGVERTGGAPRLGEQARHSGLSIEQVALSRLVMAADDLQFALSGPSKHLQVAGAEEKLQELVRQSLILAAAHDQSTIERELAATPELDLQCPADQRGRTTGTSRASSGPLVSARRPA